MLDINTRTTRSIQIYSALKHINGYQLDGGHLPKNGHCNELILAIP